MFQSPLGNKETIGPTCVSGLQCRVDVVPLLEGTGLVRFDPWVTKRGTSSEGAMVACRYLALSPRLDLLTLIRVVLPFFFCSTCL
jgi:hypothetical protein